MTTPWPRSSPEDKPPRQKTWVQPMRSVMRRWRENTISLVELECGHVEPANSWPVATSLRCQQCNPVPRNTPPPVPKPPPIDLVTGEDL